MPAFMDLKTTSAFAGMKPLYTKERLAMPHIKHVKGGQEHETSNAMKFIQRTISAHATQVSNNATLQADNDALLRKIALLQHDHRLILEEAKALKEANLDLEKKNDGLSLDIVESNGLLLRADARLTEIERELADAIQRLTSQCIETADCKAQNDNLIVHLQTLEAEHTDKQTELKAAQSLLESADARIDSLEAQLTKAREEERELRDEVQGLAIDGIDNLQKIMTLEDQLEVAKSENTVVVAQLEAELCAAKNEKATVVTRLEAELRAVKNEKAMMVRKLEKTVEELNQLEQEVMTSRVVIADVRLELELKEHALSLAHEQVDICERAKATLETQVEDLYARVGALELESAELKETLRVAEAQAKVEADSALVDLHLAQEKAKVLENCLADSDAQLVSTTQQMDALHHEIRELKATEESSRGDLFAKQIELDLLTMQEQEAVDLADAEKVAREAAEKERDDMAATMAQLLADMEKMKAQQLALQERNATLEDKAVQLEDRNKVLELQLERECDAHASTRDDLERIQTRLAIVVAEKENQPAFVKSATPARRESNILRPLQSHHNLNLEVDVQMPSLPMVPPSVRIKEDTRFTREGSPVVRSPTIPLASTPSGISSHRRSSSSFSTYRSLSDRFFGRAPSESRGNSPLAESDFFASPALS